MNMWWRGEPNSTSLKDYLFLIESKYEHNFDNGVIVLEATTYCQWEQNLAIQTSTGQGTVTAKFAVGDNNWWNGTEWQDTETSFTFRVGDENISGEGSGKGQIICNRILDSIWDNYNGYGMQINGSIGGKILFKVIKVELDDGGNQLWVDDSRFVLYVVSLIIISAATARTNTSQKTAVTSTALARIASSLPQTITMHLATASS
jgi:hypothetical protein